MPSWFWNSHEWSSITQASSKMQRPILNRALTEIKNSIQPEDNNHKKTLFRKKLSSNIISLQNKIQTQLTNSKATTVGKQLEAIKDNLEYEKQGLPDDLQQQLNKITQEIQTVLDNRQKEYPPGNIYYESFRDDEVQSIIELMTAFVNNYLRGLLTKIEFNADTPIQFDGEILADHIEILGKEEDAQQYINSLTMRIKTIFSNNRMKSIVKDNHITLEEWLNSYAGKNDEEHLAIIDLSLVPKDIIYLVTAVIARMIFEALQRYKNEEKEKKPLPTVLVMEEAHTFIQKYNKDSEDFSASKLCTEIFERIAKEGRKFGLGLVLSSQRPSELSSTVLSQCNTFLLHRITNDRDQEIVSRLLPDSLKGTMQELPALPSRHAYLLGWASEIPILTEVSHLHIDHRPKSDDPDFWDVWTRTKKGKRDINWQDIADKWQGNISPKKESG